MLHAIGTWLLLLLLLSLIELRGRVARLPGVTLLSICGLLLSICGGTQGKLARRQSETIVHSWWGDVVHSHPIRHARGVHHCLTGQFVHSTK